jgi:hypothetical protein
MHAQRARVEPLVGYDVSFSMGTIQAVLLGLRDIERLIVEGKSDFKDGLVAALPVVVDRVPEFHAPAGEPAQLRKAVGVLQNVAYGASLIPMARRLQDDLVTFGSGWGRPPTCVCSSITDVELASTLMRFAVSKASG